MDMGSIRSSRDTASGGGGGGGGSRSSSNVGENRMKPFDCVYLKQQLNCFCSVMMMMVGGGGRRNW